MNLQWISATTLSAIRLIREIHAANHFHAGGSADDVALASDLAEPVAILHERLISESIAPQPFWTCLIEEIISEDRDVPLAPARIEVAVLRAGGSQLQSDQTAAALSRQIRGCTRHIGEQHPRWAEQLKLRYAPMKQAFQAYGPGLMRGIGRRIWNGEPPSDWWPERVAVHAVSPIHRGAGDLSNLTTSLWIEAVLTDMDPAVPEWLRLAYLLTRVATNTHTRTHRTSESSDMPTSESGPGELPWDWGVIPLVLDQAIQLGVLPSETPPIRMATSMWLDPYQDPIVSENIDALETWWEDVGRQAGILPPALKRLTTMLTTVTHKSAQSNR
ncbi:MAG: hypothetical protein AAGJ40_05555 [Planctomycetota bacterium]